MFIVFQVTRRKCWDYVIFIVHLQHSMIVVCFVIYKQIYEESTEKTVKLPKLIFWVIRKTKFETLLLKHKTATSEDSPTCSLKIYRKHIYVNFRRFAKENVFKIYKNERKHWTLIVFSFKIKYDRFCVFYAYYKLSSWFSG